MDEVKDKSGKEIDVSSWKQECVEDLPEQENGCVCFSAFLALSVYTYHCSEIKLTNVLLEEENVVR